MKYIYFVSFYARNGDYHSVGNGEVEATGPIRTMAHLNEATRFLERERNLHDLVILHYALMRTEVAE